MLQCCTVRMNNIYWKYHLYASLFRSYKGNVNSVEELPQGVIRYKTTSNLSKNWDGLLLFTIRNRKHIDISLPQLISLISGTGYVHHFHSQSLWKTFFSHIITDHNLLIQQKLTLLWFPKKFHSKPIFLTDFQVENIQIIC